jgi:hypothetical protein
MNALYSYDINEDNNLLEVFVNTITNVGAEMKITRTGFWVTACCRKWIPGEVQGCNCRGNAGMRGAA